MLTTIRNYVKNNLTTLIAVTTVVLAVVATLASFKAAGYGNKMVLLQNLASDQWNYYQAKGIKETQFQTQLDTLTLLNEQAPSPALQKKIAEYSQTVKRYAQEKKEISEVAQSHELERDKAQTFNSLFGQALIFLQVGILLTSLSSINKVAAYWYLGVSFGLVGIAAFIRSLVLSF